MDSNEHVPQDEPRTETAQSQADDYTYDIPDSEMNDEEEEIKEGDELNSLASDDDREEEEFIGNFNQDEISLSRIFFNRLAKE